MQNQCSPLISLNKVSKRYETPSGSFSALRDVSLEVRQGEFIAVAGKSGCGKGVNDCDGVALP